MLYFVHKFILLLYICAYVVRAGGVTSVPEWNEWLVHNASMPLRQLKSDREVVIMGGVVHGGLETSLYRSAESTTILPSPWDIAQDSSKLEAFFDKATRMKSIELLVDTYGFEFILESLTVFPKASVVMVASDPATFLQAARKARPAYCSEDFLLSSQRLNAVRARIEDRWIAAFGVSCPSDFNLLKRYHERNLLARLLVPSDQVIIVDPSSGVGTTEACTLLKRLASNTPYPTWCASSSSSAAGGERASRFQGFGDWLRINGGNAEKYPTRLHATRSVMQAHTLYWALIHEGLAPMTGTNTGGKTIEAVDKWSKVLSRAANQCSHSVPAILGAGLSKTGTTSFTQTLESWNISAGHWVRCHSLFRLFEWDGAGANAGAGAASDRHRRRDALRALNMISRDLEALADLPIPHLLTEFLLVRPAAVVVLTTRDARAWTRSLQAWLGKSCKSKVFRGCPAPTYTVASGSSDPHLLDATVCPAGTLAFGVTCPSALQATKRYILHALFVRLVVPPQALMYENVAAADDTKALCDGVKARLTRPTPGNLIHRTCSSSAPASSQGRNAGDAIIYRGRSTAELAASLQCRVGVPYAKANVNQALHGRIGVGGSRKGKPRARLGGKRKRKPKLT